MIASLGGSLSGLSFIKSIRATSSDGLAICIYNCSFVARFNIGPICLGFTEAYILSTRSSSDWPWVMLKVTILAPCSLPFLAWSMIAFLSDCLMVELFDALSILEVFSKIKSSIDSLLPLFAMVNCVMRVRRNSWWSNNRLVRWVDAGVLQSRNNLSARVAHKCAPQELYWAREVQKYASLALISAPVRSFKNALCTNWGAR